MTCGLETRPVQLHACSEQRWIVEVRLLAGRIQDWHQGRLTPSDVRTSSIKVMGLRGSLANSVSWKWCSSACRNMVMGAVPVWPSGIGPQPYSWERGILLCTQTLLQYTWRVGLWAAHDPHRGLHLHY